MFEQADFIQWANENVVFLVGYKGKNHKTGEKAGEKTGDESGKGGEDKGEGGKSGGEKSGKAEKPAKAKAAKEGECSLYAGISCDEHEKILEDALGGKGGPKLEVKGYPTSYVIAPDGTFEQHKKDRAVKSLEDGVADFMKKAKVKPSKKYQVYLDAIEAGDKAADAGKWKDALSQYAKADAAPKKMTSLAGKVGVRVEALNAKVVEAFARVTADEACDLVAKIKAVKALKSEVGARLSTGLLPVVAEIDAWLKANPAPAPTPPAK